MSNYVVRIYRDECYHLYERGKPQAVPFREILREKGGRKRYPLEKKYDADWERVGTISLRELLLLPPEINPIYFSLRKLRGKGYDWHKFVIARKDWIGKEKKNEGKRLQIYCDRTGGTFGV